MNVMQSTAAGAFGGLLSTALLRRSLRASKKLPEAIAPTKPAEDPGEHMVSKAEQIGGAELPRPVHETAAHGLHYAYGTTFPTLLGAVAPRFTRWTQPLAAGAVLGGLVWAIGYAGWLPATGLTPPLRRQGKHVLMDVVGHVLYGIASAGPIAILVAARRRRRGARWLRALRRAL